MIDRHEQVNERAGIDRFGLVFLVVVGLAAAVLNQSIISEMAVYAGFPRDRGLLLWVAVDVYMLTSMRSAFIAQTTRVRQCAGVSAVAALLISAGAAATHVLVTDGRLPNVVAACILVLPVAVLAAAAHLILITALERRNLPRPLQTASTHPVLRSDQPAEVEIAETVTHQRQVTSRRRSGSKTAEVTAALSRLELNDPRNNSAIASALAEEVGMSAPNVRKLVASWRPQRKAA